MLGLTRPAPTGGSLRSGLSLGREIATPPTILCDASEGPRDMVSGGTTFVSFDPLLERVMSNLEGVDGAVRGGESGLTGAVGGSLFGERGAAGALFEIFGPFLLARNRKMTNPQHTSSTTAPPALPPMIYCSIPSPTGSAGRGVVTAGGFSTTSSGGERKTAGGSCRFWSSAFRRDSVRVRATVCPSLAPLTTISTSTRTPVASSLLRPSMISVTFVNTILFASRIFAAAAVASRIFSALVSNSAFVSAIVATSFTLYTVTPPLGTDVVGGGAAAGEDGAGVVTGARTAVVDSAPPVPPVVVPGAVVPGAVVPGADTRAVVVEAPSSVVVVVVVGPGAAEVVVVAPLSAPVVVVVVPAEVVVDVPSPSPTAVVVVVISAVVEVGARVVVSGGVVVGAGASAVVVHVQAHSGVVVTSSATLVSPAVVPGAVLPPTLAVVVEASCTTSAVVVFPGSVVPSSAVVVDTPSSPPGVVVVVPGASTPVVVFDAPSSPPDVVPTPAVVVVAPSASPALAEVVPGAVVL